MSDYENRIKAIHKALGIPESYVKEFGIPLQEEATELVDIGNDIYGRPQQVAAIVAQPWRQLKSKAKSDGIELQLVSAFRSVDRQQGIVQRKIDNGIGMADILRVSAAPGYSEHHTGRALDLTTPGYAALEEEFENSSAFAWLRQNASEFSFYMSYPRDNTYGIAYEPWHWAFLPPGSDLPLK